MKKNLSMYKFDLMSLDIDQDELDKCVMSLSLESLEYFLQ